MIMMLTLKNTAKQRTVARTTMYIWQPERTTRTQITSHVVSRSFSFFTADPVLGEHLKFLGEGLPVAGAEARRLSCLGGVTHARLATPSIVMTADKQETYGAVVNKRKECSRAGYQSYMSSITALFDTPMFDTTKGNCTSQKKLQRSMNLHTRPIKVITESKLYTAWRAGSGERVQVSSINSTALHCSFDVSALNKHGAKQL